MTKANLIALIADKTQRTKNESEQLLEAVLDAIAEALQQNQTVDVRGFGRFQVNDRKERQGRNPQTGESVTIAARKVAVFKPARELAERVNGSTRSAVDDGMPHAELSDGPAKLDGDKIDV